MSHRPSAEEGVPDADEELERFSTAPGQPTSELEPGPEPDPEPELEPEPELAAFSALAERPPREGKYFVVTRDMLPSVKCTGQPVDILSEFFLHHPHGGSSAEHGSLLREFVAVELTDAQIDRQRDRIRLSSYRWSQIQGVGRKQEWGAPGNFGWFLALCKKHEWIGWMDFMSNVVVNSPTEFTLRYMGQLYAECLVVQQGMFEPEMLLQSMSRAWVYQETAFGPLDEHGTTWAT
jgi:hypothetical protein